MPWVDPTSDNLVMNAKVCVHVGRNIRVGHITGTRPGRVRVTYITMERHTGTWMAASRIASVWVESPQGELDLGL